VCEHDNVAEIAERRQQPLPNHRQRNAKRARQPKETYGKAVGRDETGKEHQHSKEGYHSLCLLAPN